MLPRHGAVRIGYLLNLRVGEPNFFAAVASGVEKDDGDLLLMGVLIDGVGGSFDDVLVDGDLKDGFFPVRGSPDARRVGSGAAARLVLLRA